MRIIQLSDCHLSRDPSTRYRGVDAQGNLERVLEKAMAWAPDLLLATGDLSEDASDASYDRLAAMLAETGVAVMALPGNHDDPAEVRRRFPASPVAGAWVHEDVDWHIVLLDSTYRGGIDGRLAGSVLSALEMALAESSRPVLLALHHQPLPVGSPWIDRYALQEPGKLASVLERHPQVRLVTWGHVHQAWAGQFAGVAALACPSTASNSLPGQARFSEDPAGPACRWFELEPGGDWETGILFADR